MFREHADTVHIVVVDLIMPGLDGHEILTAMREIRPDLPAVIMSGFTPGTLHDSPRQIFLQKPFTPAALRAAVRRALGDDLDGEE
jgi:DNA-binding NtrC family response regulator